MWDTKLYSDQERPFMACHDVTEAYELSLSDMQIPLIENHSEKVVIKTKHRLKAINPHNKAIISF